VSLLAVWDRRRARVAPRFFLRFTRSAACRIFAPAFFSFVSGCFGLWFLPKRAETRNSGSSAAGPPREGDGMVQTGQDERDCRWNYEFCCHNAFSGVGLQWEHRSVHVWADGAGSRSKIRKRQLAFTLWTERSKRAACGARKSRAGGGKNPARLSKRGT
jgi:hypothetical protein